MLPTAFMKVKRGGLSKYTLNKLTAINCRRDKLFGRRLTLSIIHSATIGSSKVSVKPVNSTETNCAVVSNISRNTFLYSSSVRKMVNKTM